MTKDKWLNLIDSVEGKFGLQKKYEESFGDEHGRKEIIEFKGPGGLIKLEWVQKPKLKNIKTIYSSRIGSNVKMNRVYDENEQVSFLKAYKWNENSAVWEEFESDIFDH